MKKGSGSVVQIRNQFYSRHRQNGKDVYGPARETYEEADRDRVMLRPGTKSKAPAGYHPTLQEWAFWCMNPENERYGGYGRGLAKTTFSTNETIRLCNIEGSKLGGMKLKSIEQFHIQLFADQITKTVKIWENGKIIGTKIEPASPAWQSRVMALVSKLFSLAIDAGFIHETPCKRIKLPPVVERQNTVLSPEQTRALLNPTRRIDAMMLVAALQGLNRSELCRIQWSDITGDNLRVRGTKNQYRAKTIPLAPEAKDALLSQPKRSIFVFSTESGKPLDPHNVTRDFNERRQALGIPDTTRFQDLRGTFGTLLLESGADLKTVQSLLRHGDARTTMKFYARSRQETQRTAIHNVRALIGAEVETTPEIAAEPAEEIA